MNMLVLHGTLGHAEKVGVALKVTYRIITGCLKPTPVQRVQVLSGIALPNIRRDVAASRIEKTKPESDIIRHPLYRGNYSWRAD